MKKPILFSLLSLMVLSSNSYCENLQEVYQLAQKNNATLENARQTYLAAKQSPAIARGALLPNIGVKANEGYTNDRIKSTKSNTDAYTLSITQPLINFARYKKLWPATPSSQASSHHL